MTEDKGGVCQFVRAATPVEPDCAFVVATGEDRLPKTACPTRTASNSSTLICKDWASWGTWPEKNSFWDGLKPIPVDDASVHQSSSTWLMTRRGGSRVTSPLGVLEEVSPGEHRVLACWDTFIGSGEDLNRLISLWIAFVKRRPTGITQPRLIT